MLKFKATAMVNYDCLFSDEREKIIIETAKHLRENDKKEYGYTSTNHYYLNKAINYLCFEKSKEFDIYTNSSKSGFMTNEIEFDCYKDTNGDEIDIIEDLF